MDCDSSDVVRQHLHLAGVNADANLDAQASYRCAHRDGGMAGAGGTSKYRQEAIPSRCHLLPRSDRCARMRRLCSASTCFHAASPSLVAVSVESTMSARGGSSRAARARSARRARRYCPTRRRRPPAHPQRPRRHAQEERSRGRRARTRHSRRRPSRRGSDPAPSTGDGGSGTKTCPGIASRVVNQRKPGSRMPRPIVTGPMCTRLTIPWEIGVRHRVRRSSSVGGQRQNVPRARACRGRPSTRRLRKWHKAGARADDRLQGVAAPEERSRVD